MTDQPFASRTVLDGLLAGAVLDKMTPSGPVSRIEPTLADIEAQMGSHFASILRENLRAASHHTARGHESILFRDCPHPRCCDAANLIPHLPRAEAGAATDADLNEIFERVLTALDSGSAAANRL